MVDPASTPRDSELFAPFPEAWAEFLATAHDAIEEAARLASGRGTKPELVKQIFSRFMTNGAGFYVPFDAVGGEDFGGDSNLLIIRDFIEAFGKAEMPVYIISPVVNERPHYWPKNAWHRRKPFPENLIYLIYRPSRILCLDGGGVSCIFDNNVALFEVVVNSSWRILLPEQKPLEFSEARDPRPERIVRYSDIKQLVSNLEQEHCHQLSGLLEQWMQQQTDNLEVLAKSWLEANNVPPDKWADELRRLADRLDTRPKPLPLPDKAPELFANRPDRRENIEEFLRRVWMPWIESGALTRPAFGKLDPQGEQALQNRLRNHALPTDLHIPTLKEVNDKAIAEMPRLRDAKRLAEAARRRRLAQPG